MLTFLLTTIHVIQYKQYSKSMYVPLLYQSTVYSNHLLYSIGHFVKLFLWFLYNNHKPLILLLLYVIFRYSKLNYL